MFELLVPKNFADELKKLQKFEIVRIKEKLTSAQENPLHYFERLPGHELFRIRIGKFRVIASINFNARTITLISVGLRKNIYKKL